MADTSTLMFNDMTQERRMDAADKRMQHLQEQIDRERALLLEHENAIRKLERAFEGLIAGLPDAVRADLRRRGV